MTDIDTQLRDVFARISEPGDPAGVAESIRTRLDAGDTGTPAPNGGQSSGFGGGWFAPIAPWVGLVILVGMLGGSLGAFGVFGHPAPASSAVSVSVSAGVDALACPGGAVLERFVGGERVVATQRNDESTYLAVRDPYNLALSVWLPVDLVRVDEGQPSVDSLPVGGCPVAEVVEVTPSPSPSSEPSAEPKPKPTKKPTPDTTKPTISVGSFSPNPVYGKAAAPYCDTKTTITVTATDNKGIASVKASASFGTIKLKSHSGNKWVFTYSADYNSGSDKSVTVTFTAKDAAGNSKAKSATLTLVSAGNCLI